MPLLCPGKMYHVKSRELLLMVAEDIYSHCTSNLQCVRAAQAPGNSTGHKATFIKYQWLPKEPSSLALKWLRGSVLTIVLLSGRKRFVLGEPARRVAHLKLGPTILSTGDLSPTCLTVSRSLQKLWHHHRIGRRKWGEGKGKVNLMDVSIP